MSSEFHRAKPYSKFSKLAETFRNVPNLFVLLGVVLWLPRNGCMVAKNEHPKIADNL